MPARSGHSRAKNVDYDEDDVYSDDDYEEEEGAGDGVYFAVFNGQESEANLTAGMTDEDRGTLLLPYIFLYRHTFPTL
jgi:hypothetical protein